MAHVLANDLRAAVLQAAIQGKLTSKDKNDSLINETQKEYQIPFADGYDLELDIPDYWRFCTIQNVCETIKAGGDKPKTFSKEKTKNNSIPVIANGETNNGVIGYTDEAVIFQKSLTVSGRGTIGFSVIRDTPYYPIVRLLVLIPKQFINIKYLKIAMTALLETGVGTAVKQLTKPMISQKVIPLPPIEEQQRIVDRVDELMAKIDEYEKLENQLVQLKEQFPKDMRDSLLQAGMMGKLTEHLESDTQICSEFQVKLKNKNQLSPLPDSWKWTNLSLLVDKNDIGDGDWVLSNDMCEKSNNNLIQLGSVGNGVYVDKPFKHVSDLFFESKSCSEVYPKDILISRFISKDRMNACTVPNLDGRLFTSVDVCWIRNNPSRYCNQWLKMCLLSQTVQRQVSKYVSGTTRPRISKTNLMKIHLPLPPLEEQQRIVDKLDEMLPLVDALAQMD